MNVNAFSPGLALMSSKTFSEVSKSSVPVDFASARLLLTATVFLLGGAMMRWPASSQRQKRGPDNRVSDRRRTFIARQVSGVKPTPKLHKLRARGPLRARVLW